MAQSMLNAMSKKDRDMLRKSRTFLAEFMQQLPTVVDYLYEEKILSAQLVQDLKATTTHAKQVSTLLDILPKRGVRAFGCLVAALVKTHQDNVARGLDKNMAMELIENRQQQQGISTSTPQSETSKTSSVNELAALPIEQSNSDGDYYIMYLPIYLPRIALNSNTLQLWNFQPLV